MRQLPTIIRLLICGLLIGGYGAMYAGSISHDLGHTLRSSTQTEARPDGSLAIRADQSTSHLEVDCFFCTHAPVVSTEATVEQIWTPIIGSLASPVERTASIHAASISLPELRGPPSV